MWLRVHLTPEIIPASVKSGRMKMLTTERTESRRSVREGDYRAWRRPTTGLVNVIDVPLCLSVDEMKTLTRGRPTLDSLLLQRPRRFLCRWKELFTPKRRENQLQVYHCLYNNSEKCVGSYCKQQIHFVFSYFLFILNALRPIFTPQPFAKYR